MPPPPHSPEACNRIVATKGCFAATTSKRNTNFCVRDPAIDLECNMHASYCVRLLCRPTLLRSAESTQRNSTVQPQTAHHSMERPCTSTSTRESLARAQAVRDDTIQHPNRHTTKKDTRRSLPDTAVTKHQVVHGQPAPGRPLRRTPLPTTL